ncbi:2'-5' RNA ligase family protein [Glutamicibacter halophytocola]|uniref:2'-5' RNA ligase family protein n=1 Tax=Glutamicibacter halophytocola TaxID=1933880 RepID=A0ABX5Y6N7_9MICC|nr:2'-5' RNA ligase family protein [Glutamicibacter halophytocola]NQD39783.1 2'-5' RNA ligase [Glutamicibacter halophytocola]QDY65774.1 2'-5' RNA ligase family protein [Glutamicibacter halophytocola]
MSRSPENILLYLEAQEEAQLRGIFADLESRGFPRQNQTPHISITFAPELSDEVARRAAQLLPAAVPASLRRVGTVVFGTKRKQTVAWLMETTDDLEIAAREISALNIHGRGPRWIPHLTMGLRIPREIVPDYVRALDELGSEHQLEFTAARAGLWKPKIQQLTLLAGE